MATTTLKRCRADSSALSVSPLEFASAANTTVHTTTGCINESKSGAIATTSVDDVRSSHGSDARVCRAPTALTMKDLLNAAAPSPHTPDASCSTHIEPHTAGEWETRITLETMEIQATTIELPVVPTAASSPSAATTTASISTMTSTATTDDDALDRKCRRLAALIQTSKHLVAFTGAGISTSVGLPDYRGDNGIRTKAFEKQQKRRKVSPPPPSSSVSLPPPPTANIPDFHRLVPSVTHMALMELHRLGFLKHVVSQNVDNLHIKSGLPASVLTEVHGNATQAKCETCEKIYCDTFPSTGLCDDAACVSTKRSDAQRLRARTRHGNGRLKRNVISFDEPMGDIDLAIDECELADVALVLGTSLRVEPFTEMAGAYADALAIVNLQPTTGKLDAKAEASGVRMFANCDVVMQKVMRFLLGDDYRIPDWTGEHATQVFTPADEAKSLVNVLAGRLLS